MKNLERNEIAEPGVFGQTTSKIIDNRNHENESDIKEDINPGLASNIPLLLASKNNYLPSGLGHS